MSKLDTSFLDDALAFASHETQRWVADALACHLHNEGYALEGNREANDVDWFARNLYQHHVNGLPNQFDHVEEAERERWRGIARTVIAVLPAFQMRVAHRLIALSKVTRDIERSLRSKPRAGDRI